MHNLKLILPRPFFLMGILFSLFTFLNSLQAAIIPVGAGSYTTDLPPGRQLPSNSNGQPAYPKVTANFKQPPRTNNWWTSLIWYYNQGNPWSENLYAHPLSFKAQAAGIEVGYPANYYLTPYAPVQPGWNAQEYHYPHVKDFLVGVVGLQSPDTRVDSYTDWTVTAQWSSNNVNLQATMGSGIPFLYLTKSGGDALVTFDNAPTIWYNSNGVIGLTSNGHHYGIFAPSGSTWNVKSNSLQSNLNGKSYFSVGLLPDNQPSTLEFFRQHAYAFVTNTQVSWDYESSNSTVTTVFKAQTTLMEPGPNNSNVNRPLMALYRHQWEHSSDPFLNFTYVSSKGVMKVVDASQFTTQLTYNGVLPYLPNVAIDGTDTYSAQRLYNYIDAIYKQTFDERWNHLNPGTDSYWTGKFLERIANLVPIAEQVQHTAARDLFLAELKTQMEEWLSANSPKVLYYDQNWRTLIGYPAAYGSDIQLNDHHFHWGYYLFTAAIIAQYDPNWIQESKWGGMLNLLSKDGANPDRADPRFAFLRCFDPYAGHSWASGPSMFAPGANEESSSEDFNFATGLILWGTASNNQALRDLGIYLYSHLVSSVPLYWFDVNNNVFPPDFIPVMLGMRWGDGGAYAIWFQGGSEQVQGINFVPINPGMLYLGHFPDYLKLNQEYMAKNGGTRGSWFDIHTNIRAMYDPATAIANFNNNPNYTEEEGESHPHTYHWIHNMNSLGLVDPTVTADTPLYRVFKKNGARTYVAYNPDGAPINVTFSDGAKLTVPANSIATSRGTTPPPPPPSDHQFTTGSTDLGEVAFWFKPNWTTQSVQFNYAINNGTTTTVPMVNQNGLWTYTVGGLKNGDAINYFYSYEDDGKIVNTTASQHVYKCGGSGGGGGDDDDNPPIDTPNYTLTVSQTSSGFNVVVTPKGKTTFVDIHYTINGQNQLNYRMNLNNNQWTYNISNLKAGDVLSFFLSYDVNGLGYDSPVYSFTFANSGGGDSGGDDSDTINTADYTLNVTSSGGKFNIAVAPKGQTSFMDIHYTINGQNQLNYRMNFTNSQWTYQIPNVKNGDVLKFFLSYDVNGVGHDSPLYQFTYNES